MKKIVFISLLFVFSISVFSAERFWKNIPIVGVVDGDTIQTKISALPYPLYDMKVRISGIDAPEKGHLAKCEYEKRLGIEATAKLAELIGTFSTMTLVNPKWDKYGGRINSEVIVNNINVGQKMIELGYAKPYVETGPKPKWCQ